MSPTSDKPAQVNGSSDHKPVKRKSVDGSDGKQVLPPSKKFKLSGPTSAQNGVINNGQPPVSSMHHTIMHGPTLSPQGQLPPAQGVNGHSDVPPPGLASPVRPAAYSNGYKQSVSSMAQYTAKSHISASNGQGRADHGQIGTAHSNGHPPYQQQYSTPEPPTLSNPPYQSQNPFTNTFEKQRPTSSHSNYNLPPPVKSRPSMSPPQGNAELGPLAFPPQLSATPHTNGLPPHRSASSTQPGYSPAKNPHPSPPTASLQHSSSPVIPPPTQTPQAPLSGLSPSKNSPPRPPSAHSIASTAIMPPIAHLSPSPQVQNFHAPVKGMTPEQKRSVSGAVGGQ